MEAVSLQTNLWNRSHIQTRLGTNREQNSLPSSSQNLGEMEKYLKIIKSRQWTEYLNIKDWNKIAELGLADYFREWQLKYYPTLRDNNEFMRNHLEQKYSLAILCENWEKSIRVGAEAMKYCFDDYKIASMYQGLAIACFMLGKLDEAQEHLARASESAAISRKTDEIDEAIGHLFAGMVSAAQNNTGMAEHHFERTVELMGTYTGEDQKSKKEAVTLIRKFVVPYFKVTGQDEKLNEIKQRLAIK